MELIALELEPLGERELLRRADRGPGGTDREWRSAGDALREPDACLDDPLCRDDAGDEPEVASLECIDGSSGEDDVGRDEPAGGPRPALGPAGAGQQPEPDLRLAEDSRVPGHDEIGEKRELAPTAEHIPGSCCNEGQLECVEPTPRAHSRRGEGLRVDLQQVRRSAPDAKSLVPPVTTAAPVEGRAAASSSASASASSSSVVSALRCSGFEMVTTETVPRCSTSMFAPTEFQPVLDSLNVV